MCGDLDDGGIVVRVYGIGVWVGGYVCGGGDIILLFGCVGSRFGVCEFGGVGVRKRRRVGVDVFGDVSFRVASRCVE